MALISLMTLISLPFVRWLFVLSTNRERQAHFYCSPVFFSCLFSFDVFIICLIMSHCQLPVKHELQVSPLLTQRQFLHHMGIEERLSDVLQQSDASEADKNNLIAAARFLVDPDKMGTRFKALCIAQADLYHGPDSGSAENPAHANAAEFTRRGSRVVPVGFWTPIAQ